MKARDITLNNTTFFDCGQFEIPTDIRECSEAFWSEGKACKKCPKKDCYRNGWNKKEVDEDNARIVYNVKYKPSPLIERSAEKESIMDEYKKIYIKKISFCNDCPDMYYDDVCNEYFCVSEKLGDPDGEYLDITIENKIIIPKWCPLESIE